MALDTRLPLLAGQQESPLMALGRGIQSGQQMAATSQGVRLQQERANALKTAEGREALRQGLASSFVKMKALPPEQREAYKLIVADEVKARYGVTLPQDTVANFRTDDASIDAELAALVGRQPGLTPDQELRRREVANKEERLKFDRDQAAAELLALDSAIDQLDVDDRTKALYKQLPRGQKERQVELSLDPAKKQKLQEIDAKNAQIKQEISSFAETLSSPDFDSAVGLLDNITTMIGGLWGSKDSQLNNKINRQSKSFVIKMAKSLGANPTDRDMKILLDSIPSTWQQPEDWYNWFNDEAVPIFNARASALGLDTIDISVGGEPTQEESDNLQKTRRLRELRARTREQ